MTDDQTVELKAAWTVILNAAHCPSGNDEVAACLLDELQAEHRTNQQSLWRVLRRLVKLYSNTPSDLRNEASVQWASRVSSDDAPLPYV
jgi:hypothetical protein